MTFPRAIYKRGTYKGQIDHPGWLSKVVTDQIALDVAVEEGWQLTTLDAPPIIAPENPEETGDNTEKPDRNRKRTNKGRTARE